MVVLTRDQLEEIAVALAAVVAPAALTAVLLQLRTTSSQREYVFIYMAVVAVIAVLRGLWPALLAAAVSFLLVDYFFVPPARTLTVAASTPALAATASTSSPRILRAASSAALPAMKVTRDE